MGFVQKLHSKNCRSIKKTNQNKAKKAYKQIKKETNQTDKQKLHVNFQVYLSSKLDFIRVSQPKANIPGGDSRHYPQDG